jgi:hypothetical protein
VKFNDTSTDKVKTIYTEGSFVGYNDLADQRAFVRARADLRAGKPFDPPGDRERVWRIDATQDEQEALYRLANEQRQFINSGWNVFGDYMLNTNNCGTWARYVLQRGGLGFPAEAEKYNLSGVGVNGAMDRKGIPAAVERAVVGVHDAPQKAQRLWEDLDDRIRSWFEDAVQGGAKK